jgi:hypothetical protein
MIKPNFTQTDDMINRIDWDNILSMSRGAGGHDEQMKGLFKNVTVLGHYNEGDYQGQVSTCVQFNDTKEVVIYNDYYGSCSGCDAWEDATDNDVRDLCKQLACSAYIFADLDDCKLFLQASIVGFSKDSWRTDKELLNCIETHTID